MIKNNEIVILGAGLAGLSAAYHLKNNYVLFEKENSPGGMARSVHKDGYTFDYDGHLLHFRKEYAFNLVSGLLNGNMAAHKRDSWVYSKGIFTRYPFQANFYGLPKPVVKDCLMGLIKARLAAFEKKDMNGNFENWVIKIFGRGIADHFMLPYNRKFWTVEPGELTCEWLDGFVPVPDLEDAVTGAISDNTKPYGYNSRFLYPLKGGIYELVKGFLGRVENVNLNKKAVTIDQHRREIIFEDASIKRYKTLVSTVPLPDLIKMLVTVPSEVRHAFSQLRWTSVFVVNLGIKHEILIGKHWVYYPEDEWIFYRLGFPANFSAGLVPQKRSSIYAEIAYSDKRGIDKDEALSRVISDLIRIGVISGKDDVELFLPMDIKYGYVIYDKNRTKAVNVIKEYLERFGIYAIGRYGGWRYMSMEDVILEGKDIAEKVATGNRSQVTGTM